MNRGYIKIYRKITESWIYENPDYLKAWITILVSVNHKDQKTLISGELIDCKRGQSCFSLNSWASLFGRGWTIQKVRTFFTLLERDKKINTEGLRKTTRLTVCNYDTYQSSQQTDNTQTTDKQHGDNTQTTTTKECKNEKNDNIKDKIGDGYPNLISSVQRIREKHPRITMPLKTDAAIMAAIMSEYDKGSSLDDAIGLVEAATEEYSRITSSWGRDQQRYINGSLKWYEGGCWKQTPDQWGNGNSKGSTKRIRPEDYTDDF